MARWSSRNTKVYLVAGALEVEAGPGPGDLSASNTRWRNVEVVPKQDRGRHDGFVKTVDAVQTLSITVELPRGPRTDETIKLVEDFMRQKGAFKDAVSLRPGEAWAFQVRVVMEEGTDYAERVYPECTGSYDFSESAEGHTLTLSLENYVEPVDAPASI